MQNNEKYEKIQNNSACSCLWIYSVINWIIMVRLKLDTAYINKYLQECHMICICIDFTFLGTELNVYCRSKWIKHDAFVGSSMRFNDVGYSCSKNESESAFFQK